MKESEDRQKSCYFTRPGIYYSLGPPLHCKQSLHVLALDRSIDKFAPMEGGPPIPRAKQINLMAIGGSHRVSLIAGTEFEWPTSLPDRSRWFQCVLASYLSDGLQG